MKVTAYVPVASYTRTLPEYNEVYANQADALHAGEILWTRGARYLVVVEAEVESHLLDFFAKYGHAPCRREQVRVIKVRAARP